MEASTKEALNFENENCQPVIPIRAAQEQTRSWPTAEPELFPGIRVSCRQAEGVLEPQGYMMQNVKHSPLALNPDLMRVAQNLGPRT